MLQAVVVAESRNFEMSVENYPEQGRMMTCESLYRVNNGQ